ncbi:hypothetical protein ACOSP7_003545 [Xanthoceras sorbifolium]
MDSSTALVNGSTTTALVKEIIETVPEVTADQGVKEIQIVPEVATGEGDKESETVPEVAADQGVKEIEPVPEVVQGTAEPVPEVVQATAESVPEVVQKAIAEPVPEVVQATAESVPEVAQEAIAEPVPEVVQATAESVQEVAPATAASLAPAAAAPVVPKRLNPFARAWNIATDLSPEEDRCLFLTFSNGHPLSESQIISFFQHNFGPCVERVYVHWPDQEKYRKHPPLFGKILFKFSSIPLGILAGKNKKKFSVDGKPLWCKKFDPYRGQDMDRADN